MPPKSCEGGYTRDDLERLLGERLAAFDSWMRGQTMGICDGRRYDHGRREYEPTGCGPHGPVAYSHDVKRFLSGGSVVDW